MAVATLALIVALGGTAFAGPVADRARLVSGDRVIKKGTLSGNRLRKHTITGTQIRLSTLGTVSKASRAQSAESSNTANSANTANTANSAAEAVIAKSLTPSESFHQIGQASEPTFGDACWV